MKLDKIFHTAVEYRASDIYITTGTKPVLRIHGDLVFVEEHPVLTREQAEEYIFETMTEPQKKRLPKNWTLIMRLKSRGCPFSR